MASNGHGDARVSCHLTDSATLEKIVGFIWNPVKLERLARDRTSCIVRERTSRQGPMWDFFYVGDTWQGDVTHVRGTDSGVSEGWESWAMRSEWSSDDSVLNPRKPTQRHHKVSIVLPKKQRSSSTMLGPRNMIPHHNGTCFIITTNRLSNCQLSIIWPWLTPANVRMEILVSTWFLERQSTSHTSSWVRSMRQPRCYCGRQNGSYLGQVSDWCQPDSRSG